MNPHPRACKALTTLLLAFAAAAAGAAPKAYVGNFKDDTVSVIDTASRRVVATLPVAAGPDGIVVSRDDSHVFVSAAGADRVSVIDSAGDTVARAIVVGRGPQGLALTPDGRLLLVAVNGDDQVAFVDTATLAVAGRVAVAKPHTIAVAPDGSSAWVSSQEPGHFALVRIDLASRAVRQAVALERTPRDLEFGADGRWLYVTLAGVAAVQVWDVAAPDAARLAGTVATGVSPHVAHHFAGQAAGVVVVQGPGELLTFDPVTRQPLRHIAVGKQPHWVDGVPGGNTLLVTNEGSNDVSVVDVESGTATSIAVGTAPRKVAVQHGTPARHAHAAVPGTAATPGSPPQPASTAAAGPVVEVAIADFAFVPPALTVAAGQTVRWTNRDGAPHGVVFRDGAPGADLLLPGQDFSRRFDAAGVADYACPVHPYMTARVTVQPR